tara:strand:+ start:2954 stop:3178 length:225 start_codon:yes stop_codon:yes gene_type:complete
MTFKELFEEEMESLTPPELESLKSCEPFCRENIIRWRIDDRKRSKKKSSTENTVRLIRDGGTTGGGIRVTPSNK